MICPITQQTCTRTPNCNPTRPDQGDTFCAEWLIKQQIQGRKELEANTPKTSGKARK